jgi:hypothetical protein
VTCAICHESAERQPAGRLPEGMDWSDSTRATVRHNRCFSAREIARQQAAAQAATERAEKAAIASREAQAQRAASQTEDQVFAAKGLRRMESRFGGKCASCQFRIREGAIIGWAQGRGATCRDCVLGVARPAAMRCESCGVSERFLSTTSVGRRLCATCYANDDDA